MSGLSPLVRARLSPDEAAAIRLFERQHHVRVNAVWNPKNGFTNLSIVGDGVVEATGRTPFAAFEMATQKWGERVEIVSFLTGPAA